MKNITRQQIVFAKRAAIEMAFFAPCALDDDDNFDRLMAAKRMADITTEVSDDWGSVYLHEHLVGIKDIDTLKNIVFSNAARLLCNLCVVSLDIAVTLLVNTKTSDPENGSCTRTMYDAADIKFPSSRH
jgi:hypothetical protein